ncbi:MAG: hypothetical protein IPL70_16035 [Uliginosibacterium sp.]|nr:hypothetical protein [Uliginosibacterium sp.]
MQLMRGGNRHGERAGPWQAHFWFVIPLRKRQPCQHADAGLRRADGEQRRSPNTPARESCWPKTNRVTEKCRGLLEAVEAVVDLAEDRPHASLARQHPMP